MTERPALTPQVVLDFFKELDRVVFGLVEFSQSLRDRRGELAESGQGID